MKTVVVNPEGTGVEIVTRTKKCDHLKQRKLLFKSNTWCHTDLRRTWRPVGFQACHWTRRNQTCGAQMSRALKLGIVSVLLGSSKGCGTCNYCTTGRETLCRTVKNAGYSVDGGMAEQYPVTVDYAVKVPGLDPASFFYYVCRYLQLTRSHQRAQS